MFAWLSSFFANPALLAGTAAGSIPVVIHLLNKQRFRRIHWAAMHWLWASQKKSSRRLRIEQLILLILRILILVLLALALARPALQEGMGLLGGRASIYRIIVFDNSYSMGHLVDGRSLFGKGKDLAIQLVNGLHPGDEVDVLLAHSAVDELTPSNALQHADVIRNIRAAALSDGGTHLPRGIAQACRLILDRKSKNLRKEIIVITDETRAGWEVDGRPKKLEAAEEEWVAKAFADPKSRPKIWVLRLPGKNDRENVAAVGLEIDEKVVTRKVETQFVATVQNFGSENRRKVWVEFQVDGEKAGREEVAVLEPMKPATVVFRHTFIEAGSHALSIQLPSDNLPADDNAFLALDVEDQVKVLCVDGQQRIGPNASELDYFRQALAPSRLEEIHAGRMPLYPEVISDGAFPDTNLDAYRLVVLANVALVPAEKAAVLEQWVRRGGALWIWLGDRIDPALYNKALGKLLPAKIGEAAGSGDPEGPYEALGDKYAGHPAIRKLRNIKGMRLNALHVYRRFKLLPKKGRSFEAARTVLAFENGDPAAVEYKLGDGRVLLIGTSADRAWCNWPKKKHYMPMLNFLALDLIHPAYLLRNRLVGEAFVYRLPKEEVGAVRREGLKLRSPDGEPVPMEIVMASFSAVSKATRRAGIFRATVPGDKPRTLHFAANRNLAESDLDTIAEKEIRAYLPATPEAQPERGKLFESPVVQKDIDFLGEDFARIEAALKKHVSGREIWRWLIGAVLVLLLAESLLAMRFGNYER